MLEFNVERHEYKLDGHVIPSVTQLLKRLRRFDGVPPDVLELARERGNHVHAACHYFDEADLEEAQLKEFQPHVYPYLQGWKKFVADCDPKWSAIEKPVVHRQLRFAGTPDRVGTILVKGRRTATGIFDLKTDVVSHPTWRLQTAGYAGACLLPMDAPRYTIQLREDGGYRLIQWADMKDWPTFLSYLNTYYFEQEHHL